MFAEITRRFTVRYTTLAGVEQLKKLLTIIVGLVLMTATVRTLIALDLKPAQALAFTAMAVLTTLVISMGTSSK